MKLAVYFNDKYVLYYLNSSNNLFSKSFSTREDTYKYIKIYFEDSPYDTFHFKKESTLMQDNYIFFATKSFTYEFNINSSLRHTLQSHWLEISSIAIFILLILIDFGINFSTILFSIVGSLMLIIFVKGRSLLHYYYYYKYAKDNILIISKGDDNFYFGKRHNLRIYNKRHIHQYTLYHLGRKNLHHIISEIEFANGITLRIPVHIIDKLTLDNKLSKYKRKTKAKWFYLKN